METGPYYYCYVKITLAYHVNILILFSNIYLFGCIGSCYGMWDLLLWCMDSICGEGLSCPVVCGVLVP